MVSCHLIIKCKQHTQVCKLILPQRKSQGMPRVNHPRVDQIILRYNQQISLHGLALKIIMRPTTVAVTCLPIQSCRKNSKFFPQAVTKAVILNQFQDFIQQHKFLVIWDRKDQDISEEKGGKQQGIQGFQCYKEREGLGGDTTKKTRVLNCFLGAVTTLISQSGTVSDLVWGVLKLIKGGLCQGVDPMIFRVPKVRNQCLVATFKQLKLNSRKLNQCLDITPRCC